MQFFSEPAGAESSFSSWTLVVPAVTVGNVAQLACDLLLLNSKASRVGYLQHDALLDCVGNDPLGDASGERACDVCETGRTRFPLSQLPLY